MILIEESEKDILGPPVSLPKTPVAKRAEHVKPFLTKKDAPNALSSATLKLAEVKPDCQSDPGSPVRSPVKGSSDSSQTSRHPSGPTSLNNT